jgi:alanyl-tRNA synthetase
MFFYSGKKAPSKFNSNDEKWIEIWNDVFMQYEKTPSGTYTTLKQKNVDTGMGVERTLAILNNLDDNYKTFIFAPIIKEIELITKKTYGKNKQETKAMRIIADHIRAATFILGDVRTIKPSNIGQGYVLRRLIRRAIRYGKLLGIKTPFASKVAKSVMPIYPDYQELHRNHNFICQQLDEEEQRFNQTLEKGLKKFSELSKDKKLITGKEAFLLFQSYGFPIEFTSELADEKGIKVDLEEYNQEFQKHQDISRSMSAGMFKSGLADESDATRKLHTATHLLNEALRSILGKDIKQKGSNITPERLRFDFNFPRKLTDEEIKKIESLVNQKIKANLQVRREEIPLQDALRSEAQHEFGAKYPELVSVYTIEDPKDKKGWFSKEFCTGPHVEKTGEIGHFKIIKEESVASGIRRIKAIVE